MYHGLEILLKAILLHDIIEKEVDHGISKYFIQAIKTNDYQIALKSIKKYIIIDADTPIMLKDFLSNNCINIDSLYMYLRYPTDRKNDRIISYTDLKRQEDKGIPFYRQLKEDIQSTRIEVYKLYHA